MKIIILNHIKKTMEIKGISQKALASELDISKGAISHLLSGRNKMSLEQFYAICKKLQIMPSQFFSEVEKKK